MPFPTHRMRRLRRLPGLRRLVRESALGVDDLILPLFVCPGSGVRREVPSMPGVFQLSTDQIVEEGKRAGDLGIPAVILFGIPETKDAEGSSSWSPQGVVQRGLEGLAREVPGLVRIADLCFCEYTDHGHCGILAGKDVDNDATLAASAAQAVSLAEAGADVLAPSGMMDGAVRAIRAALDQGGHRDLAILSYAAKFASAFYGPFRDAAGSAPAFGDRSAYQMDPANSREALREIELDIEEGADIVMVKPALAYLDVVCRARQAFDVPLAAYNVSGEYALIRAAGKMGWIDEKRVILETLTAIKRAGADMILTYFALEAAQWL